MLRVLLYLWALPVTLLGMLVGPRLLRW